MHQPLELIEWPCYALNQRMPTEMAAKSGQPELIAWPGMAVLLGLFEKLERLVRLVPPVHLD